MADENDVMEETEEVKVDPVIGQIAEYVVDGLIKADINAYPEAGLLYQVLTYKLDGIAKPLMVDIVNSVSHEVSQGNNLNLIQKVGGITQAKRISFRTKDQYKAFMTLFFEAAEEDTDTTMFCKDEETLEKFMLYCIYGMMEKLDTFVKSIAEERMELERKEKFYIARVKATDDKELPSYTDYVVARIGTLSNSTC
jgi:hypothetical protein